MRQVLDTPSPGGVEGEHGPEDRRWKVGWGMPYNDFGQLDPDGHHAYDPTKPAPSLPGLQMSAGTFLIVGVVVFGLVFLLMLF